MKESPFGHWPPTELPIPSFAITADATKSVVLPGSEDAVQLPTSCSSFRTCSNRSHASSLFFALDPLFRTVSLGSPGPPGVRSQKVLGKFLEREGGRRLEKVGESGRKRSSRSKPKCDVELELET